MKHIKTFKTISDHIDCQGIMDGLYYPYYMEEVRHEFAKDFLNFDLEEQAKNGINMILTEYNIKFKRSLIKDDVFEVDCTAEIAGPAKIQFNQNIIKDGKTVTTGTFFATCVNTAGGRPFIPDNIKNTLEKQGE